MFLCYLAADEIGRQRLSTSLLRITTLLRVSTLLRGIAALLRITTLLRIAALLREPEEDHQIAEWEK